MSKYNKEQLIQNSLRMRKSRWHKLKPTKLNMIQGFEKFFIIGWSYFVVFFLNFWINWTVSVCETFCILERERNEHARAARALFPGISCGVATAGYTLLRPATSQHHPLAAGHTETGAASDREAITISSCACLSNYHTPFWH